LQTSPAPRNDYFSKAIVCAIIWEFAKLFSGMLAMAHKNSLAAVVLAAGKGTRMNSSLPKVLHQVAGKSMLDWVLDAVESVGATSICLVLGGDLTAFDPLLARRPGRLTVAVQKDRRGTADAVASTAESFADVPKPPYFNGEHRLGDRIVADWVLICTGDAPNINPATLARFIGEAHAAGAELAVVGMIHPKPTGYGRLIVDEQGFLQRIVEEKDADERTKRIDLCNSGVILAKTQTLFELLCHVGTTNAQKEYYLTDVFGLAHQRQIRTYVFRTANWQEFEGVNDMQQLKHVEQLILERR
jgi:bifunctional UDP-N-acetylglucosamine pyrophosphorylase/glucosamine-1-phosphate N-acetyltransferase